MTPEYLEATQFLPNLPKSNLDDRTFEELLEECILRIPRYCPEWTNYNPGDPGITLVELFAWLTDQMLYRFNQVPRRNYVAFLELLGIRLLPPASAQTELTFYLTKSQKQPMLIPAGTEVATLRTENQEAIVFTTDTALVIGHPQIKHLLTAREQSERPSENDLVNRYENTPQEQERQWNNLEVPFRLFEPCRPESCFYVVLDATDTSAESSDRIDGNVLALKVRGPIAVTTGINPENPPLHWEAWNGEQWEGGILRAQTDDKTKGFSFDKLGDFGPNPEQQGADVILHLPRHWPKATFGRYQGHWIRCIHMPADSQAQRFNYQRSPEITGVTVRAIGACISASECITIENELLGVSNGKPGQRFELQGQPVLQRRAPEHIRLHLPNGDWQDWQEVTDFGDSHAGSLHYVLDSQSGRVQFGPLVREPDQIPEQTKERRRLQSWGKMRQYRPPAAGEAEVSAVSEAGQQQMRQQYGQVPPLGAEIFMTRYRVGGGSKGNVQAEQITVLKTAMPYIKRVINYPRAEGGHDGESLEDAVMRVPAILRNRKTALTPEEFEAIARRLPSKRPIYRAHCITTPHLTTSGTIRLLAIPGYSRQDELDWQAGLHPDVYALDQTLCNQLQDYLNLHKALGIHVQAEAPEYVGICVKAQVFPQPQFQGERGHWELGDTLTTRLYQFLNPLVGGLNGQGWPLGRAVRSSDIVALLQNMAGVQYVGAVTLASVRRYGEEEEAAWFMESVVGNTLELGELEVVCSWRGRTGLDCGHQIEFME